MAVSVESEFRKNGCKNHRRVIPPFSDKSSPIRRTVKRYAKRLIKSHSGFSASDEEDVEQELSLQAFRSIDRYDTKRSSLQTYIDRLCRNRGASIIRHLEATRRDFRRNSHSLNETVRDADGGSVEWAQTLDAPSATNHTGQSRRTDEEQSQLRLDIGEVLKALPDDLRQLADLLQCMTEYAASLELGKPRRQVANDVVQLRELFEDADLRDYL